MKHTYHMYKFVQMISDEKLNSVVPVGTLADYQHTYAKRVGCSFSVSRAACMSALEKGYISEVEVGNDNPLLKLRWIEVTAKGNDLIDGLWIFPTGLWNELITTNGPLLKILASGTFAAAVLIVVHFMEWLIGLF